MNIIDIIEKKKNKCSLTKEEINYIVKDYTNGNIPDYQMSALLMSIVINGMNDDEIVNLTLAMAKSGEHLDLSVFQNNTVDKHSTGGVGDKTTLIIAPIVAALDCKVAKMSGKGLGYTGGTIDKLESIPGFKTQMSETDFINQVNDINIALISQTKNIAPADKKIYALRDVTATVESIPLIASSIMSKKIASGAKNLVLDVKVGNGAFMKNINDATTLAHTMVTIGNMCNINTIAVLTDMNQPLGNAIGNIIEVKEAIDTLKGNGPEDLKTICLELASHMVMLTKNISLEEAKIKVKEVIDNDLAYKKFEQFIKAQGGDLSKLENLKAKYSYEVRSTKEGYITAMDTEQIGKISCELGAGRKHKDDVIDYTAGIILNKKIGDYVHPGDLLAHLYTSQEIAINNIIEDYGKTIMVDAIAKESSSIIIQII